MLDKIKSTVSNTAWLALGATAIAVEKGCDIAKDLASEVKDGTPQEYARWRYRSAKSQYSNLRAKYHCPHNEPLHFHHDGCPACDV